MESPKNIENAEVSYSGFQEWCEALSGELRTLAERASPEEREVIERFIQELDDETNAQRASLGVETDVSDLASMKAALAADCEIMLKSLKSVDTDGLMAAAQAGADQLR